MHRAQDRANPTRPPASILCTGHRIHEFRLGCSPPVATLGASQQGSSLLVVTMHRAQDRANPTRPPASILCTGQRIHEFRLVTPSILYTGHRIHKFRAGLLSYEHAPGSATVVVIMHRAPDCANLYPPTCVNSMLRALGSQVLFGLSVILYAQGTGFTSTVAVAQVVACTLSILVCIFSFF